MKKLTERETPEVKTIKIEPACMRYGVGRNTMRKIAEVALEKMSDDRKLLPERYQGEGE